VASCKEDATTKGPKPLTPDYFSGAARMDVGTLAKLLPFLRAMDSQVKEKPNHDQES
jgi:hypothetical protein